VSSLEGIGCWLLVCGECEAVGRYRRELLGGTIKRGSSSTRTREEALKGRGGRGGLV